MLASRLDAYDPARDLLTARRFACLTLRVQIGTKKEGTTTIMMIVIMENLNTLY